MVTVASMPAGDEFLRLLDPDPAVARAKYEALSARLVKFFEWRQCPSPEDLAQDTILRVFQKAIRKEVDFNTPDVTPYFFAVAKFVVLEDRRTVSKRGEVQLDPELSLASLDFTQVETRIGLRQCLEHLSDDDREILVRYVIVGERATLRRRFKLSEEALRVRVHRIIARLKRLMQRHSVAGDGLK